MARWKMAWWGLAGLVLLLAGLLYGKDVTLLDPKGLIAGEQMKLMVFSAGLLLAVAVPVVALLYFFAWKYRESNPKAAYDPHTRRPKLLALATWGIPSVFMLALALVMWPATHRLEPRKAIVSNVQPLTIQVVALRWKWLFIYPEQKLATVNFVELPAGRPIRFELTADETPMSSFWIPHLGGQLYAMTGHVNQLNLMAETPGDYTGSTAEINGAGFAHMKFTARVGSQQDFDLWAQGVMRSGRTLDAAGYAQLLKPSENNSVALYALADPGLYDTVLMKYMGSHDHHTEHE